MCAGLIDVQFSGVQCYGSQLGSLCFLDLYLEVVVFTVMETYYRFEGFLFPFFFMDALDVLLKPLSALILAFVLYFKVSGQVPLSVCLFRDLVAPLAWLILSSANRL